MSCCGTVPGRRRTRYRRPPPRGRTPCSARVRRRPARRSGGAGPGPTGSAGCSQASHADHRVPGDQPGQLRLGHPLGARRALRQHEIADLGLESHTRISTSSGSGQPISASSARGSRTIAGPVRRGPCTRPAAAPAPATGSTSTACRRRRCGRRECSPPPPCGRPRARRSRARRWRRCRRPAAAPVRGIRPGPGHDLRPVQGAYLRLVPAGDLLDEALRHQSPLGQQRLKRGDPLLDRRQGGRVMPLLAHAGSR